VTLDQLEPPERGTAVRVQIHEQIPRRRATAGFTRHHESLPGLVHHAYVRDLLRHGARLIGAGIVDDQDFVGDSGLGEEGMEAGSHELCLVMGADDDADPQRHVHAVRADCRGIPTCIYQNLTGPV
jgi:hypothetical protein